MKAAEIAKEAPGPAVAVDRDNRILAMNRPARRLFGFSGRTSLLGRPFFELVEGRDVFGNRLADPAGGLWRMVAHREPLSSFEISARSTSGEGLRLAAHVIVVLGHESSEHELVYLLTPVLRRRRADETIERILTRGEIPTGLEPANRPVPSADLTPRQTEVLRLLAQGANVDEIAGTLGISVHTVRTHVQRILETLDVHSQVEAVALAFRDRLI